MTHSGRPPCRVLLRAAVMSRGLALALDHGGQSRLGAPPPAMFRTAQDLLPPSAARPHPARSCDSARAEGARLARVRLPCARQPPERAGPDLPAPTLARLRAGRA